MKQQRRVPREIRMQDAYDVGARALQFRDAMITIEQRNAPQSDAVLPSAPLSARGASTLSMRTVREQDPQEKRSESVEREERWDDLPCTD